MAGRPGGDHGQTTSGAKAARQCETSGSLLPEILLGMAHPFVVAACQRPWFGSTNWMSGQMARSCWY
jgi:hypothetical protein